MKRSPSGPGFAGFLTPVLAGVLAAGCPALVAGCAAGPREGAGRETADLDRAVGAFAGALRSRDYAGAYGRMCPARRAGTSAEALSAEFGRYAAPWRVDVWASSYSPRRSGFANVRLTAADRTTAGYVWDVEFDGGYEGGQWRVCRVRPGPVGVPERSPASATKYG